MIALTFSYRSIKKEAYLRLRYRNGSVSIEVPTEIKVKKSFWDKYRVGSNFKGENKDLQTSLDASTQNLKKYVLAEIDTVEASVINKDWLLTVVNNFFNPSVPEDEEMVPHRLLEYLDYYIALRDHELSTAAKKKWGVIKRKLERFQIASNQTIDLKGVNDIFKKKFVEYCRSENYSQNTIQREFNFIKTLCRHARMKGAEVNRELDTLKIKKESVTNVYLTFSDLDKIKKVENLHDYLDNARDWLIISCYVGQRVSDLMRFDSSMIRKEKGAVFLDTKQIKTGKEVVIPLLPEVIEVLDKRNGEFPRPISDVKYNVYIKEVCKKAGLNEKTKGKVAQNISSKENETKMRNVSGVYPKWQLVTSHIGRRSFATNYYGKLPTSYLKDITGHRTEQMLLTYIHKSSEDTGFEAYELLLKAKR